MTRTVLKAPAGSEGGTATNASVRDTVVGVIEDIRRRGDEAVREYSQKFDKWAPESFRLSAEDVEKIIAGVPDQVI